MSDEVRRKTTEHDFAVFKAEARKWLDRLGMQSWQVSFEHSEAPGCRGCFDAQLSSRQAVITLASDWEEDQVTLEKVRRTAFHEVFELLLGELSFLASARYADDVVDEATHRVVRTMENALFDYEQLQGRDKVPYAPSLIRGSDREQEY